MLLKQICKFEKPWVESLGVVVFSVGLFLIHLLAFCFVPPTFLTLPTLKYFPLLSTIDLAI